MKGLKLAAGLVLSAALSGQAAPAPWLEVKSQHFTVVTNAGDKEARRTAWQFEQIRQALQIIWPWAMVDGGKPITIFAVRDEATLKTLGPQYWEGKRYRPTSFWVGDSDRTYIALRTDLAEPDDVGMNPYQTAYWSYVSLVLHRSLPGSVPAWYSRGLTEVLSNTIVREKEIHVGRLMNDHLRRLRESAAIPLDEFLAADRKSKYLTQEVDSWQFESQSWAFVHFLMFGNKGEHRSKVDRFNMLLAKGTDTGVAMKEAFGPDMTPYYVGMREYIKREIFLYGRIAVALDLKPEGFSSKALSPSESAVQGARFLVAMGRPVEARAMAAQGASSDPKNPGPAEIEGLLLDRERKTADALASFEKAAELGSKSARIYYRLAQAAFPVGQRPDKATNEKIAGLLQKALDLEPDKANALSYMADTQAELGNVSEAVTLAERAVRIEPDGSYHRLALARALSKSQRVDEAMTSARAALSTADNEQEERNAQNFIDFLARSPRTNPASAPISAKPGDVVVAGKRIVPGATSETAVVSVEEQLVDKCLVQQDNAACGQAEPFLKKKCDAREARSCRELGSLYDGGFGVTQDKAKAAATYTAGCREADKPSCARLAVLRVQGTGVSRDMVGGLATLERLCGEKVDDACIGWALLLVSRPEIRDVTKARGLLQASCEKKNEEACQFLKSLSPK